MQRIRIKFKKGLEVKFISHLDIIRTFERAIRRAELPVAFSQGFNPRMRISWGPPLSIGIESDCEMSDLYLESLMDQKKTIESLNQTLPSGLKILEAKLIDLKEPSLDSSINRAEYLVEIDAENPNGTKLQIDNILKREKIEVKKKDKIINKKPMLYELSLVDGHNIKMVLQVGGKGTLKPKEILDLIDGIEVKSIKRVGLFVA